MCLLVLIPAILGWGYLFQKCLKRLWHLDLDVNVGERGLVGLAALAFLGEVLHVFASLSVVLTSAVIAAGLAFFVFASSRSQLRPDALLWLTAVSALLISIAFHCGLYGDSGLYHLQSVMWNQQYALSPGLANLHGRFGMNSLWMIVAAMLALPKAGLAPVFLVNVILSAFFMTALLVRFSHSTTESKSSSAMYSFLLSTVCVLLALNVFQFRPREFDPLASPSVDLPAALLTLYVLYLLIKVLAMPADASSRNLAFLLASFAVTIKVSVFPLLLCCFAALALGQRSDLKQLVERSCGVLVLTGAWLGAWMLRGLGLSGCLAYPLSATCITALPWSVPREQADNISRWIKSWARTPGPSPDVVLGNWKWVKGWFTAVVASPLCRALALLVVIGVFFILVGLVLKTKVKRRALWITLSFSCVGLLFWFFGAPAPRFGAGFILGFGLLLAAAGFRSVPVIAKPLLNARKALGTIIFVLFIAKAAFNLKDVRRRDLFGGWPALPGVQCYEQKIASGQTVRLPIGTDVCWSTALPCTPDYYFDPMLKMRLVGNRYFFDAPARRPDQLY